MMAVSLPATGFANDGSNEALYRKLSGIGIGKGDSSLFDKLSNYSKNLDWDRADETEFVGDLRIVKGINEKTAESEARIYLLRKLSGELYILSLPADPSALAEDGDSPYAGLDGISGNKMVFNVKTMHTMVDGEAYKLAKLVSGPEQMRLDRIFKICIVLMLFFVMSIVLTPLLLALYCADKPEIAIPVKAVIQTILILVIIPLMVGMAIRGKWKSLAEKATPFFSALGIIALLVLIIVGVLSNLHAFADTARYGFKFYTTIFSLTMLSMLFGILFPKLFRINNYQIRAISLETGLRNSALAMTIALLIQDAMGDFYGSMFVTSGVFGLSMYLAGVIAIFLYKPLLPVNDPS